MSGQALVTTDDAEIDNMTDDDVREFVTFKIAGQLFGIPVLIVQDILLPEKIASIPLAPPEVRGSINLRGRIVTVIDVRVRLGLERREINKAVEQAKIAAAEAVKAGGKEDPEAERELVDQVEAVQAKVRSHMMGVTVEQHNELYTLLVDSVGDVISLNKKNYEGNPGTLDPLWRDFASGVYRLDSDLMVVLDVERLLDIKM
ncbi:MAG: chemotaxis protein CheW [Magnetovibrio sp.]|nr:chemotaxis protein CheW [Magnetovibrio sp.]